jgi:RNA polymerase sigma-70 factor (ECF subfamily)
MQTLAPPLPPGATGTAEAPIELPVQQLPFEEVYREHFGFVWRTARALGVRPPFVEDVVQEIFVVVHRRLSSFEGRSTVRTWLSRIVLNVVRHHRRSVVRKSPHDLDPEGPGDPDDVASRGPDPYERTALTEQARLVQRILDGLDDPKREVLVLAELEELTVPEIADALGLKLNTAYSRLRLARKAFDVALAREGLVEA